MKTASVGLTAHIAGQATTLATLWRVARTDGEVFRFTDHDEDLTVDAETYLAATGFQRSAIGSTTGLAVDELEVVGWLNAEVITEADLLAGRWDFAEVRVSICNWADTSQGAVTLRRGWLGEVDAGDDGAFRAELRGLAQALQQRTGELYSSECRADLGDARCGAPIEPARVARETEYALGAVVRPPGSSSLRSDDGGLAWRCTTAGETASSAPSYAGGVGDTVTDGTAVFTAEEAFTVGNTVAASPAPGASSFTVATAFAQTRQAVDAWFTGGVIVWESGDNAGLASEVAAYDASAGTIDLLLPPPSTILATDAFRISPGCDKRLATCSGSFSNAINFRGEPHVPGSDAAFGGSLA